MAKKHKSSKLLRLVLIIPTLLNLATNFFLLARAETISIRKNFTKIIILALIATVLLSSAWGCLLGLLVIYLVSLNLGLLFSVVIILVLNILLLIIISLFIALLKAKLTYPETRQAIQDLINH